MEGYCQTQDWQLRRSGMPIFEKLPLSRLRSHYLYSIETPPVELCSIELSPPIEMSPLQSLPSEYAPTGLSLLEHMAVGTTPDQQPWPSAGNEEDVLLHKYFIF